MPQTSIGEPVIGYPGQIAEQGPSYAYTAAVEGTGAEPGKAVKYGTDPDEQVSILETGDTVSIGTFAGFIKMEPVRDLSDGGLSAGDGVSVLQFGSIYLNYAEAVTRGEMVSINLADGTFRGYPVGTVAGDITVGEVLLPGVRVAQTIAAAGVARTHVNLFGLQPDALVGV